MAGVALIFHALANPHYGFFRDELYFIICGRHPALGYVDQPPLTPLLAAATQLLGNSLFALRLVPALCAAATVYVSCLLVREMRGGRFAEVFASVIVLLAPVLASYGGKLSTDTLEMPLWPLAALCVLRVTQGASPRWWIGAGMAIGFALESKYSALFFAATLLLGLALSPQRKALLSPWFAAGVGVATLIALPNFLWQAHYGFPMIELLRNGQLGKNVLLSPGQYTMQQLLLTNPALSIVWIAGLAWLLRDSAMRWLGYAYLFLIGIMIAAHAKDYYPAAVYPILFAAGSTAIEAGTQRAVWTRPLIAVVATVLGLILIPFALPVLPERAFIAYERTLHVAPSTSEHHRMRELPQDWADMHGWPELARQVGAVYDALPAAERKDAAVVFAADYGQAAAIEFFNPHVPVLSGHNQYWLWGPRGHSGAVVLDISSGDCGRDRGYYGEATRMATFSAPYVMAYEDRRPITVCRKPRQRLQALWPELKHYE